MPEHEKLEARKAEHEAITGFLNWLEGSDYDIVTFDREGDHRTANFPRLVAEYLHINQDAFHAEKHALLAYVREVQGL